MAGTRTRTALLTAVAVVLGWLLIGGIAGPYAGKLSRVATNDNLDFLPSDAEATRAQKLAALFVRPTMPAIVVYERTSGITDADRQRASADAEQFAQVKGVVGPLPPPVPSQDGQALEVLVPLDESLGDDLRPSVEQLRALVGHNSTRGLAVHVTGPAGLLADLVEIFKSIDVTLLLVTACVVLVILLVVYRSPVLWIIPLLSAGLSYAVAATAVYFMADAGVIQVNGQAQGILTVLVFGAGTDYALLLISRYREELHRFDRTVDAMKVAWRGAAPAIIGSAVTVIASLLCLLLSGLNSNQALGPVSALGVAATLVVMLTFLPALLLFGGRWVFWPRTPSLGTEEPYGALWQRVAALVARRARIIWIGIAVVLVALTSGLTQFGSTTLGQSDLFTKRTDSVAGQEILTRHYPGGSGSPTLIITAAPAAERVTAAAKAVPGVVEVRALPVVPGPPVAAPNTPAAEPKVVDGRIELLATLSAPADSVEAEQTVRRLRAAVHTVPGADAVVGGFTAINLDTADATHRDRNVIIPVVLAVIAVVLALLLRSLLAPILLIATVVLSFAATLGLCALLFRYAFGFPGVDASFPLFAFVFLVALGIDYNIFLMTRVREESLRLGTRKGTLRGLVSTGGVITSAGIVLAATFSTLAVLPMVVLVELGVAVALGVLLDTVVVRSLLVPALSYDLGRRIWWPSALSRREVPDDGRAERS